MASETRERNTKREKTDALDSRQRFDRVFDRGLDLTTHLAPGVFCLLCPVPYSQPPVLPSLPPPFSSTPWVANAHTHTRVTVLPNGPTQAESHARREAPARTLPVLRPSLLRPKRLPRACPGAAPEGSVPSENGRRGRSHPPFPAPPPLPGPASPSASPSPPFREGLKSPGPSPRPSSASPRPPLLRPTPPLAPRQRTDVGEVVPENTRLVADKVRLENDVACGRRVGGAVGVSNGCWAQQKGGGRGGRRERRDARRLRPGRPTAASNAPSATPLRARAERRATRAPPTCHRHTLDHEMNEPGQHKPARQQTLHRREMHAAACGASRGREGGGAVRTGWGLAVRASRGGGEEVGDEQRVPCLAPQRPAPDRTKLASARACTPTSEKHAPE